MKECESITKTTEWQRNCPKCNSSIYYTTKGNYTASIKNDCLCRSCSNFLKRWKSTTLPIKKYCYSCLKEINHHRQYCSKKCFDVYQRRYKLPCKQCKRITSHKFCSNSCFLEFKSNERRRKCIQCNTEINSYLGKNLKFCSKKCSGLNKRKTVPIKNCKFCDKTFSNSQKKVNFCCHLCSVVYYLRYGNRTSKPELMFKKILQKSNIDFQHHFPLKNKVYDFYIPKKNLLIEIDGLYWHGKGLSDFELNEVQTKNRINDKIKACIAEKNGYNLVRIWEDEIENVPEHIYRSQE